MARKPNNLEDLSKIIIENIFDPNLGKYILGDLNKVAKQVLSKASGVVSPGDYLSVRQLGTDPNTGRQLIELITLTKNFENVANVTKRTLEALGGDFKASTHLRLPADSSTGVAQFSDYAKKEAANQAHQLREIERQKKEREAFDKVSDKLISKAESDEAKEEAKKLQEEISEVKAAKERDKEYEALISEAESNEAKQLEQEAKVKEKEEQAHKREIKSNILKVVAGLTVVADITRRILSSVMERAAEVARQTIEANNLGVSYQTLRDAKIAEIKLGLDSGVITNAMKDIQTAFGNITMLDEGALDKLAVVMGTEVEDLVRTGLGYSNPEQLMERIVDVFNERANTGYNSVGEYVGQAQARRELYSYLAKISPSLASIYAALNEAQNNPNSIYRNVSNYRELIEATNPNLMGITTSERGVVYTMSELDKSVKGLWEQMKEQIVVAVAPDLLKALNAISNFRLLMDPTESWKLDVKNREANQAFIDETTEKRNKLRESTANMTGMDKLEAEAWIKTLDSAIAEANQANERKVNVPNIAQIMTMPYLQVMAGKEARKRVELQTNYSSFFEQLGLETTDITQLLGANAEAVLKSYYKDNLEAMKAKYREEYIANETAKIINSRRRITRVEANRIKENAANLTDTDILVGLAKEDTAFAHQIYAMSFRDIEKDTQTGSIASNLLLPSDAEIQARLLKAGYDPASTYTIRGFNVDEGGGKFTHRIVVDVNKKGVLDTGDLELASYEGKGTESAIAQYEGGVVMYNMTATAE